MEDITKAIEINELNRQDKFDLLEKGKSLPIGTIKKRPNGNFIKTAQGWKYHSSNKSTPNQESGDKQHIGDMGGADKLSAARKLGIKNPEQYTPAQLNKLLISANVDKEFAKFKEQTKSAPKGPSVKFSEANQTYQVIDAEGKILDDFATKPRAEAYLKNVAMRQESTSGTKTADRFSSVVKNAEDNKFVIEETNKELKRSGGATYTSKDHERAQNMALDKLEQKKRNKKKAEFEKPESTTPKESKKEVELKRLRQTYSNVSNSSLKFQINKMKGKYDKMEKEDKMRDSANKRGIHIREKRAKIKLLEQILKERQE